MTERNLLDDPILQAAFASDNPSAAVDMLVERRATLTDVLLAYAGTPPHWTDGMPRAVLARWLELHEPDRIIGARTMPSGTSGPSVRQPRHLAVSRITEDAHLFARTVSGDPDIQRAIANTASEAVIYGRSPMLAGSHPAVVAASARAKAVVCRDCKRRVLKLFPEVEHAWQLDDDCRIRAAKPHPVRSLCVRLPAPQWIEMDVTEIAVLDESGAPVGGMALGWREDAAP